MNNMRNKILSLLVLLMTVASGAWAEEVTIGDPTSTSTYSYLPSYSLYEYSFTQQIYTADEIGMSGTITTLTMWLKNNSSYPRNINVYMKEVSGSIFEANNSWVSLSADDLVGTATINNDVFDPTETTFTLETPFEYSGTGNLLICICDITGDWSSGMGGVVFETASNQSLYAYRDEFAYDISNPGGAGTLDNIKNVVRLDIEESSNVDVTTNVEEGDTCFTEAWFNMPAFDATADYELVRDMEYKVNAYVGTDAEATYIHRVEKVSDNLYKPVNITDDAQIIALFNVIDTIDAASPKPLVYGTDFTVTIVDEDQNETVPAEFNFAPGIYTVKVTGIGDYDGLIDSRNQFKLYYGYELKVAPRNYATYYKDEPLTTANENAELYTIASINGSKAVLSEQMQSVPKNTPFLIYNNHQTDTVTFVLFPVEGGQLSLIQYAPEFKGTLNDSIMPASSEGTKYYICNGYDFVWVRNAGTIAANRCWLEISNSNARALNIVFGDEATSIKNLTPTLSEGEGAWYDLNGRKLNGMPTRKGVYILNGKKTVIK